MTAPTTTGGIRSTAFTELSEAIPPALTSIEIELATRGWLFTDPERRKALSRARDFLQRIRERLEPQETGALVPTGAELEAITGLVQRAGDKKRRYGRENAWDLAEELRVAILPFLPDEALFCLLEKERADASSIGWTKLFPAEELERLLATTRPADFRQTTLEHLRRLHHERVDRVRHDRARDKLWQHFVWKLMPVVSLLVATCVVVSFAARSYLPVAAGALGAILSAVLKLREGEQRIRTLRRSATFLYLQPLIGAIAAQVMMWFDVHHAIKLDSPSLDVAVGFLAGFSEPFFLGTISRLAEIPATSKGDETPESPAIPAPKGM